MRPHLERGHGLLPGRRGPEHGAPAGDRPQAGELWGWAVTQGVGWRRLCISISGIIVNILMLSIYVLTKL